MIVITNPNSADNELEIIHKLFEEGLTLLHIRKPYAGKNEIKQFIENIKPEYHAKLVLHQQYDVADEYAINRLHFTEKIKPDFNMFINDPDKSTDWIFSVSTHSMEDFNGLQNSFEYAFLSPVYNSISKPDYKSDGSIISSLKFRTNSTTKLIALGGIDYNNYAQTIALGFDGVALLGCIWNADDPVKEFKKCYKNIDTSC